MCQKPIEKRGWKYFIDQILFSLHITELPLMPLKKMSVEITYGLLLTIYVFSFVFTLISTEKSRQRRMTKTEDMEFDDVCYQTMQIS